MADTCKTCRFWNLTREGGGYPAYVIADGSWENPDLGECRIRSLVRFPDRTEREWCGEHQPVGTSPAQPIGPCNVKIYHPKCDCGGDGEGR